MVLPAIARSPPKRRCHREWLSSAKLRTARLVFLGAEGAPHLGCTPSSGNRLAETRSPLSSSGSMCPLGPPVRLMRISCMAAISSTARLPLCHARKLAGATNILYRFCEGFFSQITSRRSASRNGSGLSSTVSTTLKMAVAAPIPSARVSRATVVNAGAFPSKRTPYRRSCPEKCMACQVNRIAYWDGQDSVDSRRNRLQLLTRSDATERRFQVEWIEIPPLTLCRRICAPPPLTAGLQAVAARSPPGASEIGVDAAAEVVRAHAGAGA